MTCLFYTSFLDSHSMLFSWSKQTKIETSDPLSILLVVILLFVMGGEAVAQEAEKRSLEAIPAVKEPIRIDGLLNEPVWREGVAATGFIQQEPFVGALSLTETAVRVAYDDALAHEGPLSWE